MFIESVMLDNFECFGPGRTTIRLDPGLTAFIGANGSGKTAVCQALLRMFGITAQERAVHADDFHVPVGETSSPSTRELTIEAVLAFPELDGEELDGEGSDDADAAEDTDDADWQDLKRGVYEDAGVASYWIFDPKVPSLLVCELVDGRYIDVAKASGTEETHLERPFPVRLCPAELAKG
jgi:hypothetical protein